MQFDKLSALTPVHLGLWWNGDERRDRYPQCEQQPEPVSERRLSDLVPVGVLTQTFPPELVDEVTAECERTKQRHRSLPARLIPARRRRSNPRLVKRKYVKWHVKRAHHRDWPQPTRPPVVTLLPVN